MESTGTPGPGGRLAKASDETALRMVRQSNKLAPSLLARAFSGKLVPQDPNDEPAEKLLEKIRQQRAKG